MANKVTWLLVTCACILGTTSTLLMTLLNRLAKTAIFEATVFKLLYYIIVKLGVQEVSDNSYWERVGFRSGDSGGARHQDILFSEKKSSISVEQCFGSLSCCSLWLSAKHSFMNGNNPASSICLYCCASIIPLNIMMLVAPKMILHPKCAVLQDAYLKALTVCTGISS